MCARSSTARCNVSASSGSISCSSIGGITPVPGCLEAALWLDRATACQGKIDLIGGTNFDTPHVEAW